MRKMGFVLSAVVALAMLAGCAKPPQPEIDAAKAAMDDANSAQASDYAPDSVRAAEDAMAQLEAELKVQEEKFALFRSYKKATELASSARAAADKAKADAVAGKEKARNDAESSIASAKTAVQEAKDILAKAPRGKGTQADLAALQADLTGADSTLAEADSAFSSERYKDARAKAEAAMSTATNVKSAVEQAIAARAAARKGRR